MSVLLLGITRGATSQLIPVRFQDLSLLNGAGKTGLTTSSFTSVYYYRGLAASPVQITLDGTMTPGTWKTSGFAEVSSANQPGEYQIGLPNLAVGTADASPYLTIVFVPTTASGANQVEIIIPLTAFDLQTATEPVNVTQWNGTNVASPATAGIPDVNVKNINNVSASSVTTVNANQGTTQPVNFTGTGGSALAKVDVTDIATVAVNPATAQIGANVVSYASGQVPLQPTVAGRTLDVSVGGEAGVDWANVGSPTATNDLTNTKINTTDNAVPATLAASQPNYAPAKVGDAMTLTAAYDAAKTAATQTSVNNVQTTANDIQTDVDEIQVTLGTPAGASVSADIGAVKTDTFSILARIGAFTGTGVNTLLGFLRAIMRNDLTAPSDVGGTYDPTADSLQAIATGTTPSGIAQSVWNYLVSSAGTDITKMGGYISVFLAAIRAKTDTIGAASVVVVSPVTAAGNLEITQGDSYFAADGRSFPFIYTGQPSFIGGAALLRFTPLGSNATINIGSDSVPVYFLTGTIISATQVQFEMTSAQSAKLPANSNGGNNARFEVQITLSDGSVITPTPLNLGKVSVSPQAAP